MTRDAHPDPASIRLPGLVAAEIVRHAVADQPNEACGLILGSGLLAEGGEPRRYVGCRNVHADPRRHFEIDARQLLGLLTDGDRTGESFWAVVHSHVASPAMPSPTDISLAAWWPGTIWLLVSLAPLPAIRAWWIQDGSASELAMELT